MILADASREPNTHEHAGQSPRHAPLWRKGALRSDNEASACVHRQVKALIPILERAVEMPPNLIRLNGQQRHATELFIQPIQQMRTLCFSPKLIADVQATVQAGVNGKIEALVVDLEICRGCRRHEPEPK